MSLWDRCYHYLRWDPMSLKNLSPSFPFVWGWWEAPSRRVTVNVNGFGLGSYKNTLELSPWDSWLLVHKSTLNTSVLSVYTLFKKILFIYFFFRERGREGEREGEKHRCEREMSIGCLLCTPQPGTKPATQACALTENWTGDASLC